jgi:hypothetical protein
MFQALYDLVLYDILGYTGVNDLPYLELAHLFSIILMTFTVFGLFKLALYLAFWPFRSLL